MHWQIMTAYSRMVPLSLEWHREKTLSFLLLSELFSAKFYVCEIFLLISYLVNHGAVINAMDS